MMPLSMGGAQGGFEAIYAKADRIKAEKEKSDAEAASKRAILAEEQAKIKEI